MDLGLVDQAVEKVDLDGFSIVIWFADRSTVRIETSCDFAEGTQRLAIDPAGAAKDPLRWTSLAGRRVSMAAADEVDGSAELIIDDGVVIVVRPDPDYEAWTFTAADGRLVVAEPGGGIATWGPRDS